MKTKKEVSFNRIVIKMDREEAFAGDPGMGTPVMVESKDGEFMASLGCAVGEGELHGGFNMDKVMRLTEKEMDFLCEFDDSWVWEG